MGKDHSPIDNSSDSSSDVPSFSVTKEDQAGHRRTTTRKRTNTRSRKASSAPTIKHENLKDSSSGLGTLLFLLFLVSVTGGSYLYYQQWLFQQAFQSARIEIENQQQVIADLQKRLSDTGQEANLSVASINKTLKDQDFEIRKLWDVANKRNKKLIASNKEQVASLSSGQSTVKKELQSLKTQVDGQKEIKGQIDQVQQTTDSLKTDQAQQASAIEQLQQSETKINTLLAKIDDGLSGNQANQQQLEDEMLSTKLLLEDLQIRLQLLEDEASNSAPQ